MWSGVNFSILPKYTVFLRYNNHLARCLDSTWWIVAPGVGLLRLLGRHIFLSTAFMGHRGLCAPPAPPLPAYLSALAASTPQYPQSPDAVWQAHWIIFPSQVGETQQRGLAVQRWRLARCWVRCLACFRWKCGYVIFSHVAVEKVFPPLDSSIQKMWIISLSLLSLFNRLWLLARDQFSPAFVCRTRHRTGNARDIWFLCDAVIVLLGEFLARKTPFTVIECE